MAIGDALKELKGNTEITPAEMPIEKLNLLKQEIAECTPEQSEECIAILDQAIPRALGVARVGLQDLRDHIEDPGLTTRNLVTVAGGRNISSWTPETADTQRVNQIIEQHGETPITGLSLNKIDVTPSQAVSLALSVIGENINHETVESYQTNHRIESDGIIGKETYGEMLAGVIVGRVDTLSPETQSAILQLFEYANPQGFNMILLRASLRAKRTELEETENFEALYGVFFESVDIANTAANESEEGQTLQQEVESEMQRPDADGRSMYRRIADGVENGNIGEEIASLIDDKGPMVLFFLAAGFILGIGPKKLYSTGATNTWWKRLLIGGVALWNGDSIRDIANDLTGWGRKKYLSTTEGTLQERIFQARGQTGNDLGRLFPNEDLLSQTLTHFDTIEGIRSTNLDNIRGYITALEAGEEDNIPDFLREISINGTRLSNEQIAAVLGSMLETRSEGDSTIGDLFEGSSLITQAGLALGGGGLAWGLLKKFPPLATWSLAIGIGVVVYDNWDEIWEYLQKNPFFDGLDDRIGDIIGSIDNEELRASVQSVLENSDAAIETQISALQALSRENSESSSNIAQLIDIMIGIHVEALDTISGAIENISDLTSSVVALRMYIPIVESHITEEAEKNRLLGIIQERIAEIENEIELRPVRDARQSVTDIRESIGEIDNDIAELVERREELETQQLTATADELILIQGELTEIPAQIAELERQKGLQEVDLRSAEQVVADIDVGIYTPTVAGHRVFLTDTFETAVSTQGIVTATNLNAPKIIGIQQQLEQVEGAIQPAGNTSEKAALTASISQAQALIENITTRYRAEYAGETVTAESLRDQGFDLGTDEGFQDYRSYYANSIFTIPENLAEFLGVSRQSQEDINTLFQGEFTRQIVATEAEFVAAPANNVQALRATLQRREDMIGRYADLFDVAYENTEFQDIIARKREQIEGLEVTQIDGFNTAYENMIDDIEGIDEATGNQFKQLPSDDQYNTIGELRGFFTQVENEGLAGIDNTIETLLIEAWEELQNRLLNI